MPLLLERYSDAKTIKLGGVTGLPTSEAKDQWSSSCDLLTKDSNVIMLFTPYVKIDKEGNVVSSSVVGRTTIDEAIAETFANR